MVAWKPDPYTIGLFALENADKNPEFQLILEKQELWDPWGHTPS